eukprot:2768555-Prymnesium_polylepis.1
MKPEPFLPNVTVPHHHTPRLVPYGAQTADCLSKDVVINLHNGQTVTRASLAHTHIDEWLGRLRVRLTYSRLAPDHHAPRLVPYGSKTAA